MSTTPKGVENTEDRGNLRDRKLLRGWLLLLLLLPLLDYCC